MMMIIKMMMMAAAACHATLDCQLKESPTLSRPIKYLSLSSGPIRFYDPVVWTLALWSIGGGSRTNNVQLVYPDLPPLSAHPGDLARDSG